MPSELQFLESFADQLPYWWWLMKFSQPLLLIFMLFCQLGFEEWILVSFLPMPQSPICTGESWWCWFEDRWENKEHLGKKRSEPLQRLERKRWKIYPDWIATEFTCKSNCGWKNLFIWEIVQHLKFVLVKCTCNYTSLKVSISISLFQCIEPQSCMQGKGDAISMCGVARIITVPSSRDSILETMWKVWENLQKMLLKRDR